MIPVYLTLTVAADGTGTVADRKARRGFLYGIEYIKTNYADGIDFTVNSTNSVTADLLYTGTNVNASATLIPRLDTVTNAGVSQTSYINMIPFSGKLSVTVAQGGNATSGAFILWVIED
jgi:hypothetical protein